MRRLFQKMGFGDPEEIPRGSELDGALAAWREAGDGPERLSPGARARTVREAARPRPAVGSVALPSLFPTGARLAWAAVVPALALTAAVGLAVGPRLTPADPGPVRIQATKVGGEVVFEIANGSRKHRVTRISHPGAGEDRKVVTARGAFRDRLESGADLVFYRVD